MTTIGSLPGTGQPVRQPEHANRHGKTGAQAAVDSNSDASIWRDSALRYGGYADEVGEFAAPYLGGLGKFVGYLIASVYCLSDLGTTIPRKYLNAPDDLSTGKKAKSTAAETADLSIFHLVATLLVPPRLIGMAVHSAERVFDPQVLAAAQKALDKEADDLKQAGNILKKGMHLISKAKLAGEETLHNLISPTMKRMIDHQGASSGMMSSMQGAVNGLIGRFGSGMGDIVNGTAYLAEKYDQFMPFEAFKDTEMPGTLRENAKFLKEGRQLGQRDVAKLVLMKPWPVLVGIGMVPLIAHPFDKLTVKVMDWTIRPLLGKNKIVRGEDGKLKSIHNPAFWGTPKEPVAPTPHQPQRAHWPSRHPAQPAQTASQSAVPMSHQPLPYLEFGAVYPPIRPLVPTPPALSAPPASPFTNVGALQYAAPLANRPLTPFSPGMTPNQPMIFSAGAMPQPYARPYGSAL